MKKPILVALISFVGMCGTTLMITYFKQDSFDWSRAIIDGLALAFCIFVVAHWQEKRKLSQQDSQH